MISVCIPTFNGALYIEEQLKSILSQLDHTAEVIISDDHSTDHTLEIINALNDSRIKIVMNDKRASPIYNLENALTHAQGDLIFLSDQDDIWMPDKVSRLMPLLNTYDLVLSDAIVIDGSGNTLHPSFFKINYSGNGFIRNWVNNSFMGCCMTFNRKILNYVLPFPENIAMHDSWIGLNAVLIGKYYLLHQPLIYYRRHGNNTIPSFKKNHLSVIYQIRYRMYMMYQIIKRRMFGRINNLQASSKRF